MKQLHEIIDDLLGESIRRNKLYLDLKDKTNPQDLNILYNFIMKHGTAPALTKTGRVLVMTDNNDS